jgi:thermitase
MKVNPLRVMVCVLALVVTGVLSFNTNAAQPGDDTTPPQVAIYSPGDGGTVTGKVPVLFTSFDSGGIAKMELYVDGELRQTLLPTARTPYFTWNANKEDKGTHELCVKVYDMAGNCGTSVSCYVSVSK